MVSYDRRICYHRCTAEIVDSSAALRICSALAPAVGESKAVYVNRSCMYCHDPLEPVGIQCQSARPVYRKRAIIGNNHLASGQRDRLRRAEWRRRKQYFVVVRRRVGRRDRLAQTAICIARAVVGVSDLGYGVDGGEGNLSRAKDKQ